MFYQSIDQSIDQSNNQPTNQSINQSIQTGRICSTMDLLVRIDCVNETLIPKSLQITQLH